MSHPGASRLTTKQRSAVITDFTVACMHSEHLASSCYGPATAERYAQVVIFLAGGSGTEPVLPPCPPGRLTLGVASAMHSDFEPPKRAVCPATSACMHSVCTWTASGRGRGTGRLGVMRLPPFDSSEGAHPGRLEARRTRYRDRDRFTLTSGAARDSGRQRRPVRHHPAVPWVRWITCRQPSQHHHQRQR